MRAPRNASASPSPPMLAAALACLLASAVCAAAQATPAAPQQTAHAHTAARGVELYKQGKLDEAAAVLRAAVKADKTDAESWHLLGVVLNRAGKAKEARKAFETAIKRSPGHAEAHAGLAYTLLVANKMKDAERAARRALELAPRSPTARYTLGVVRLRQGRSYEALTEAERVIADSPDFAPAHRLRGQAHIDVYAGEAAEVLEESIKRKSPDAPAARARRWGHLAEAAGSFERYVQLAPDAPDSASVREQLESLRVHAWLSANGADKAAYTAREVTSKAVVLSRPEPSYTEDARKEDVEGMVILRLVLAADGQVKHIFVVRGLSHGLTEKAVAAARRIQFKPAMRDGRPVSQFVTVMYNFSIY